MKTQRDSIPRKRTAAPAIDKTPISKRQQLKAESARATMSLRRAAQFRAMCGKLEAIYLEGTARAIRAATRSIGFVYELVSQPDASRPAFARGRRAPERIPGRARRR
jgi:hypothetical protein